MEHHWIRHFVYGAYENSFVGFDGFFVEMTDLADT